MSGARPASQSARPSDAGATSQPACRGGRRRCCARSASRTIAAPTEICTSPHQLPKHHLQSAEGSQAWAERHPGPGRSRRSADLRHVIEIASISAAQSSRDGMVIFGVIVESAARSDHGIVVTAQTVDQAVATDPGSEDDAARQAADDTEANARTRAPAPSAGRHEGHGHPVQAQQPEGSRLATGEQRSPARRAAGHGPDS